VIFVFKQKLKQKKKRILKTNWKKNDLAKFKRMLPHCTRFQVAFCRFSVLLYCPIFHFLKAVKMYIKVLFSFFQFMLLLLPAMISAF